MDRANDVSARDEGHNLEPRDRLRLLAALRSSPLFSRSSAHLFHDLLDAVRVRELARGDRLAHEDDFFFAVLSGRLHAYTVAQDGRRRLAAALGPGDTFGEAELVRGDAIEHEVVADAPARVAVLTAPDLADLPAHMHRELQRTSRELEGHAHTFLLGAAEPTLIYLSAPEGLDARTVDGLAVQLGLAIERQFGERVAVVGRHEDGWRRLPAAPEPVNKPKKRPKLPETWRAALGESGPGPDYLLVSLGPERRPHVLPEVKAEGLDGIYVVLAGPDGDADHAGPDRDECLVTALLDPSAPRTTRRRSIDLFGYDEGRNRSCRLLLGPGALARAAAAHTDEARAAFAEEYADTLGRWARFVTRRSVAFALGGLGATSTSPCSSGRSPRGCPWTSRAARASGPW